MNLQGKNITVWVDGGSRNKKQDAAIGVFITAEPDFTHEIAEYIGAATNNQAEYTALITAMEFAIKNQVQSMTVLTDSEVLHNQIHGIYSCNAPTLAPLLLKVKTLATRLPYFEIAMTSVEAGEKPRDGNKDADRLVNEAFAAAKVQGKLHK